MAASGARTTCFLCNSPLRTDQAVYLPDCETQHFQRFHFACLVNHFSNMYQYGTTCDFQCPMCTVPVTGIDEKLTAPKGSLKSLKQIEDVRNPTFQQIWPYVFYPIQAMRDQEARMIMRGTQPPPNLRGLSREILPSDGSPEMSYPCSMCNHVLGSMLWACFDTCGHTFHVSCLAHSILQRWLQRSSRSRTISCPLCPKSSVTVPRDIVRLKTSLGQGVSHRENQVSINSVYHCAMFLAAR